MPSSTPESPASDELAATCVRESRITTHRDARIRRVVGASLGATTLLATVVVDSPHLGIVSLSLNGAAFGFLQGVFHQ